MRIKFAAYAIAAMLIGVSVMMLPLALETVPSTYEPEGQPDFSNAYTDGKSAGEQRSLSHDLYGLASQPSNFLPSSLILLAGLVVAFSAYIIFKKQLR